MKHKLAPQFSLAAMTGSIWRQRVWHNCLHVQETAVETSHYHNKVSLAPFFHQAPVPHVLISHGDPRDHTLV